MDINRKEYKSVSNCIGFGLCIFLAMINGIQILRAPLSAVLFENLTYDTYNVIDTVIFDIVGYMASFILPAIIIRRSLRKKGLLQPIKQESGRLTSTSLLLIPVGVWVTQAVGNINVVIMDIFGTSEAYAELVGAGAGEYYFPYEIALMFISMAIVPAVAEEFLFRATVLSNLKPYGKAMALVGSSILFGLMHQNPYQLLYTTAAGFIMGYAYLKTGSVWCPMLIHFFNNAYSVANQVLLANAEENVAMVVIVTFEILLAVAAIICLVRYIKKMRAEKRRKYKDGSFGVLLEESRDYSSKPVEKGRIRGFFSPGIVTFVTLTLLLSFLLLTQLMAMSGGAA